ncbi:MAG: hypothetical protein ACJAR2_003451, partial [Ilumatobacter sp.]
RRVERRRRLGCWRRGDFLRDVGPIDVCDEVHDFATSSCLADDSDAAVRAELSVDWIHG